MSQENQQLPEVPEVERPTSLHLFQYGSDRLSQLQQHVIYANRYRVEVEQASGTSPADHVIGNRLTTLFEVSNDLDSQVLTVAGGRILTNTYLTLLEEMEDKDVSEDRVFNFYKQCLQLHFQYFGGIESNSAEVVRSKVAQRGYGLGAAIRANKIQLPSWLNDSVNNKEAYLLEHVSFSDYLAKKNTITRGVDHGESLSDSEVENMFLTMLFVSRESLPDWFLEDSKQPPSRDVLEDELKDDTQILLDLYSQILALEKEQQQLLVLEREKLRRRMLHVTRRKEALFSIPSDLADAIILLHASHGYSSYGLTAAQLETVPMASINTRRIDPEIAFAKEIQAIVANTELTLGREMVALWIEEQLREGNIITSADEVLEGKSMELFSFFLSDLRQQKDERARQALSELRDQNKKGFKVLLFEIGPLLQQVGIDELGELEFALSIMSGQQVEWFIMEMAERISDNKGIFRDELKNPNAKRAISDIQKFAHRWIRDNWQWGYSHLVEVIEDPTKYQLTEHPLEVDQQVPDKGYSDIEAEQSGEIEAGNLSGWKLQTIDNHGHVIELHGSTLSAYVQSLREYLGENSISCSIKPESIVNAFNWVVTVPEAVEQIRPTIDIKKKSYKKLTRGSTRLLYRVNREGKEIIFYIEQKKDWGYSFDRPSSR